MSETASRRRQTALALLSGQTLDVLVVGGGIVGSGIARDATMRGLKVGLIEQHDFAFGSSSRSSRLLHGGLRYLAQGRIGLVREASVEKKVIHRIAPHLADPLPFVFPGYAGSKDWILWQLKIGVKIYDLLCSGRNLGRSTWLSRQETLRKMPGLLADGLQGAVRYYDGFTNDARLTLDTLRSAARHGAILANYCRFANALPGEAWVCQVQDELSGQALEVRARTVVNATGPWAEQVPHSAVKLRLTKGIHLVVEKARVPVDETLVLTEGKRILFAIPWGERTILGTTDTDYEGACEAVSTAREDTRYVLGVVNQFLPQARLTENDVISSWAGLRPLIASPGGGPSDISRSHQIRNPERGWWDVAGGKLTTYRLMAEQTVDRLLGDLGANGSTPRVAPCRTAEEPLLPPNEIDGTSGLLPPKFSRAAVEHCCRAEWAVHLDDVMIRRTSWHYYYRDARAMAVEVAGWMADIFGWTEGIAAAELAHYQEKCCPGEIGCACSTHVVTR